MKHCSIDFREPGTQEIDYVLKVSYGNDSIALIQWMREYCQKHPSSRRIVALYNDTGWASSWWPARVNKGEALARSYGFETDRTTSIGMEALVMKKQGWPTSQEKFCTQVLKIEPYQAWMSHHDPNCCATTVVGVRREESFARSQWPEWIEDSEVDGGRSAWSPLVLKSKDDRDELIRRAGWEPLPHRSRECRCILANRSDLATWSEDDIAEIERIEKAAGFTASGHPRVMFRPHKKMGAIGIREVIKWAHSKRGEYEPPERSQCDSGFCEA